MGNLGSDRAFSIRVGVFTVLGIFLTIAITLFVNDKPYWWRSCNLVNINVNDATGLRMKSPVRSLGLQIGYIHSVQLAGDHVKLKICLTAPVDVHEGTRAYIRPEGFLGDQFVELKPVHYLGDGTGPPGLPAKKKKPTEKSNEQSQNKQLVPIHPAFSAAMLLASRSSWAQGSSEATPEVKMGEGNENISNLVKRVDGLVVELKDLTKNLKGALDPEQLKDTMKQLNKTLSNAAKTLSPEGQLTSTAQRTLAKLEDSIEQLRQILTRINQGEGSVGSLINDPVYANELKLALKNLNNLLSKASRMRIVVNLGGARLQAYEGSRGFLSVGIWPTSYRYYLVGFAVDPRGKVTTTTTTTEAGGASTTTKTTQVEESGLLLTGMLGIVLWHRVDLAVGVLYGDGALRTGFLLGPETDESRIQIVNEVYARQIGTGGGPGINDRLTLKIFPSRSPYLSPLYVIGGMDSFRKVNGKIDYFFGGGISFDDNDIRVLFSFL